MTLIVLIVATLVFRLLGAVLHLDRFATWRVSAAHGLAVMLVMTAGAHFVPPGVTFMPNHADMVAMVPPFVPFPAFVVYLTGVLELAGAVGLVLPATRRAAGICLALLFVLMLPANVHAALAGTTFGGEPATPLWQRVPEQILYIGVALWAAGVLERRAARTAPASGASPAL
ncbi:DoxX family protein [Streptosporangium sandarakinum]|uniref:DoxX family protein n=1 Tax=Streptosporangium sandarakinum TaxID=1260955 RepID=UPI0033B23649